GNVEHMAAWAKRAAAVGADLIVFPELAVTGYPPEDLVLRPAFVADGLAALNDLARRTSDACAAVVGFVDRDATGPHNAAAFCRARAGETGAWIVYVNTVGGQDELVFDGGSMVVSPGGEIACRAAMFEEDLLIVEIEDDAVSADHVAVWPEPVEEVYRALVLGL